MNEIKYSMVSPSAVVEKSPPETAKASRPGIRKAAGGRASVSRGASPGTRADRFTVSEGAAGNAVYDIRDIGRGQSSLSPVRVEPLLARLRGEIVIQKMVEIPLSTGRKRLSVYRMDE
ncbi:MAG: hypothetical protein ACYC9O_19170 [Candidatus Latescibacterota bacterium]